MEVLPDLLNHNLRLVFCGTAASAVSAQAEAYYANPTNAFWPTLYRVGLTPRQLPPLEYGQLLNYGIGLTDLAKNVSGNDSDLEYADFDVEALRFKIALYQPNIVAFTSKTAAAIALNTRTSALSYGKLPAHISVAQLWVLPSPSGAARRYWDESHWQALADVVATA